MFATSRMKRIAATVGAITAIAIAGLQYGNTTQAAGTAKVKPVSVTVLLRDFTISMTQHHIPAGTPVTFILENRGKAMHEAVLERAGAVDKALEVRGKKYEADDIAPGTTRTVTWTVPRHGEYQLACHKPGHFQMGMKITFNVTGR